MRRGVLCIGTGRYSSLIPALQANLAEQDAADVLFCLTDDSAMLAEPEVTVSGVTSVRLPWGSLAWPLPTLYRYHAISLYSPLIRERVSHLVYCDVDMRVVGDTRPLFGDRLVAVLHPGYWDLEPHIYPYEDDPRSAACFRPRTGCAYVAGGVQGGPVEEYLSAVRDCASAVLADHLKGLTARWHDESHWNRYVNSHPDVHRLGPEFCWPESQPVPHALAPPRILALDKDHDAMRGIHRSFPRLRRVLRDVPAARRARDVARRVAAR